MSAILDDMDSRPGSTTSLLRTVVGLSLRRIGGWIAVADLIRLMDELGVGAPNTRTAVVRLKKKGLLLPRTVRGVVGYELNADAAGMLERGDRRIFTARTMGDNDAWCVISFSIPEDRRSIRHQLRRRLHWIGCGTVSPALWICPDYLSGEVEEILDELGIREFATLFRTERPRVDGSLREAVAGWWDLDELQQVHRSFIGQLSAILAEDGDSEAEAFSRYIRGIDAWRIIPYLDPGLPPDLMPDDWPGAESLRLFAQLRERFEDRGLARVLALRA